MSRRIATSLRKSKLKIEWEEPEPPPPTLWQRIKQWFKELPIWSTGKW